jgi:hypothetical protein
MTLRWSQALLDASQSVTELFESLQGVQEIAGKLEISRQRPTLIDAYARLHRVSLGNNFARETYRRWERDLSEVPSCP